MCIIAHTMSMDLVWGKGMSDNFTMEFVTEISLGFSPICLTGSSFVGLMV